MVVFCTTENFLYQKFILNLNCLVGSINIWVCVAFAFLEWNTALVAIWIDFHRCTLESWKAVFFFECFSLHDIEQYSVNECKIQLKICNYSPGKSSHWTSRENHILRSLVFPVKFPVWKIYRPCFFLPQLATDASKFSPSRFKFLMRFGRWLIEKLSWKMCN